MDGTVTVAVYHCIECDEYQTATGSWVLQNQKQNQNNISFTV